MKKYALGTFAGFPFAIDEVANQNDNDHYLKDAIVGLASDGYSARVILSGVELTYPGNGTTDVSNGVVANNGELYVVTGGNYAGELVANNLNLVIDNSGDESILWAMGR